MGFHHIGIVPAVAPAGHSNFLAWLDSGRDGGLGYLRQQAEPRRDPSSILEGVRSILMAAVVYGRGAAEAPLSPRHGKVARYARGQDYHEVLWRRLDRLGEWLIALVPGSRFRSVADSAPLLEREFAQRAGLGWVGKNTMLLDKKLGSYFVLGALLTDLELEYDEPHASAHCGTCTACLDACPTGAFDAPYVLDAGKCISTWTIEHRGPLPAEAEGRLNGWVFGCDICQEVCPWNRKAPVSDEPALIARDEWSAPDLISWFQMHPARFDRLLRGTALRRAKRAGLLRNAAEILAANGVVEALPALRGMAGDERESEVVRAACLRAIERIESASGP